MASEIVWTRLLSLILGPSVYAFGIILFVYLSGIAIGSLWMPRLARGGIGQTAVGVILVAASGAAALSMMVFGFLPYVFVEVARRIHPTPNGLRLIELALSAVVLFPGAVLGGVLIPVVTRWTGGEGGEAAPAASVLGWNTLGCILGAVLTGLVIIPRAGFLPALLGVMAGYLTAGIGLVLGSNKSGSRATRFAFAALAVVFLGVFAFNAPRFWDHAVLSSGVYKYAVGEALHGDAAGIRVGKILYYREGVSSTVAVIETKDDRVLSIDGKADATARGDQSTQMLLAALPLSLSKRAESALVVGFASGTTSGVASLFEGIRVTSVEIEPAVYEASRFFGEVNHGPLAGPHLLLTGDGRHFLKRTPGRFDVITSEPSNPWMSGVAPLFTREFFVLAKARLAEGGVMCQWLPIYGMSFELVASVMKTFASVFPHAMLFESQEGSDVLLVGSESPLLLDAARIEERWSSQKLRADLRSIGILSGLDLVARFRMGQKGIARLAEGAVMNTDDNGYLEYGAPLSLHLRTARRNNRLLSDFSEGIGDYLAPSMRTDVIRSGLAGRFAARGEPRLGESLWQPPSK
jgi:spermidine synthase